VTDIREYLVIPAKAGIQNPVENLSPQTTDTEKDETPGEKLSLTETTECTEEDSFLCRCPIDKGNVS
jgi:hypothetical protein